MTVAPGLPPAPTEETAGLLSWTSTANDNNRIRFLMPVELYPPDTTAPEPPPADITAYVTGLADHGGMFTDVKTLAIGGVPATLQTAKASRSLDGALGCPVKGADQAEGCFGLQPEYALRLAVLTVGGKPLLIWARTDATAPDNAFLTAFETMLGSVAFR